MFTPLFQSLCREFGIPRPNIQSRLSGGQSCREASEWQQSLSRMMEGQGVNGLVVGARGCAAARPVVRSLPTSNRTPPFASLLPASLCFWRRRGSVGVVCPRQQCLARSLVNWTGNHARQCPSTTAQLDFCDHCSLRERGSHWCSCAPEK